MAHAIDTTNGQSAFVSANTAAWHQLGTTLDHAFTADEAMTEGLLGGWDVRKYPLQTTTDTGLVLPVPGRNSVIRTNPVSKAPEVLGVVGDGYHVIQNEEHAAFLDTLVDESGAHFETAGALHGGRQVFITMRLPGHIKVGGVDPVHNYIAAVNSHDGSMSFTLMVTPVRVVCANTLNLAFQNKSHMIRVRHKSGAMRNLQTAAREALDISFNYLDGFQEQAEQLINTTLTQGRFEELITKEFGPSEDAGKAATTRAEAKVEAMAELFSDSFTQEGVRETAWAGLGALTEWADHLAPTRGEDREASRATTAVLNPGFKNRALDLMLSV